MLFPLNLVIYFIRFLDINTCFSYFSQVFNNLGDEVPPVYLNKFSRNKLDCIYVGKNLVIYWLLQQFASRKFWFY